MRRRDAAGLIAGASVGWPGMALAQQATGMRWIGVQSSGSEKDQVVQNALQVFRQELQALGWLEGQNVHIDYRYGDGDATLMRSDAAELVSLKPDVILASSPAVVASLKLQTQSIPIVFVRISDPVTAGIVTNLARPSGNITGFTSYTPSVGGKWVQLLKEVAPSITRAAIAFNPLTTNRVSLAPFQVAAKTLGVDVIVLRIQSPKEIERALSMLAGKPTTGLIIPDDTFMFINRDQIVKAAAKYRLPAVYYLDNFTVAGGLMSYGVLTFDQFRLAASYVDRILKGAKIDELPIQNPTKFQLSLNLKTAKALGLTVPQSLLIQADEVIR